MKTTDLRDFPLIPFGEAPPDNAADYWKVRYLKAKDDNVALHKGIRRLKKKQAELEYDLDAVAKLLVQADKFLIEKTGKDSARWVIEELFGEAEEYKCDIIKQEPTNA